MTARRVLLVDDTADLRDMLRMAFSRADGFEVVAEAGDGRAGLEVAERERPDVVLLDLAMPVMDGLEALPGMRALLPDAVIVVLSGFGAGAMATQAVDRGADGYVEKGTSLKALLARVRELADARLPTAG